MLKSLAVGLSLGATVVLGGCSTNGGEGTAGASGGSTGGTNGQTTASSSSTGGTTSAGACAQLEYHCFDQQVQSNCCVGLVCDSSNLCAMPSDTTGGATTGSATGGTSTGGSTGQGPSGTFEQSIVVSGTTRSYYLHVPTSLSQSDAPVVFGLHGAGDTPDNFVSGAKLDALSDEEGFILVAPAALDGLWAENNDLASFQVDIQFLLDLLETVEGSYSVDSKRVYLCGFSRGAVFTGAFVTGSGQGASIGIQYVDPFVAAATSAGADAWGGQLDFSISTPKIPLWMMHGTSDQTLSFSADQAFAEALQDAGWSAEFTAIQGADHDWLWQSQYGYTDEDLWTFFAQHPAP